MTQCLASLQDTPQLFDDADSCWWGNEMIKTDHIYQERGVTVACSISRADLRPVMTTDHFCVICWLCSVKTWFNLAHLKIYWISNDISVDWGSPSPLITIQSCWWQMKSGLKQSISLSTWTTRYTRFKYYNKMPSNNINLLIKFFHHHLMHLTSKN